MTHHKSKRSAGLGDLGQKVGVLKNCCLVAIAKAARSTSSGAFDAAVCPEQASCLLYVVITICKVRSAHYWTHFAQFVRCAVRTLLDSLCPICKVRTAHPTGLTLPNL